MREYLFRGKMIANGKWSEGNLLVTKQGCCITPDATSGADTRVQRMAMD